MTNVTGLTNTSILVVGSEGMLGRSLVKTLLDLGSRVVGVDVVDVSLGAHSDRHYTYCRLDRNMRQFYEDLFCEHRILRAVYCAGVSVFTSWQERTDADIDLVLDNNLRGFIWMTRGFLMNFNENCTDNEAGSVVAVGSVYGSTAPDFRIYTDCARVWPEIYGASKAALVQLVRYYSSMSAGERVRFNSVSPGGIVSDDGSQGPDFLEKYSARVPLGRLAHHDEVVSAICFLLSEDSSYVTGQDILIDGGLSVW